LFEGLVSIIPAVMAFFMATLLFFVSRTAIKFDNIFGDQPLLFWALGFFYGYRMAARKRIVYYAACLRALFHVLK
jgi:hypothetical protein